MDYGCNKLCVKPALHGLSLEVAGGEIEPIIIRRLSLHNQWSFLGFR